MVARAVRHKSGKLTFSTVCPSCYVCPLQKHEKCRFQSLERETVQEEPQALFAIRFFAIICLNIDENIGGLEFLSMCVDAEDEFTT